MIGNANICVTPPPVAITVMGAVSVLLVVAAAMCRMLVCLPDPDRLDGAKETVTPAGTPLAARVTAPVNPADDVTEMVTLTLPPGTMVDDARFAEIVNGSAVIVSATVVDFVTPPEVMEKVRVLGPIAAVPDATRITGSEPACVDGIDAAVTPLGKPETVIEVAEANAPAGVTVSTICPLPACGKLSAAGAMENENPGTVTERASGAVWISPPPVAVTLSVYEPAVMPAAALSVRVLDPEPGAAMLAGEKLAVSPAGSPTTESATPELKPPPTVVVTLTWVLDPAATAAGEETVKLSEGTGVPLQCWTN